MPCDMWPEGQRPEPETKVKGRKRCAPEPSEVDHRRTPRTQWLLGVCTHRPTPAPPVHGAGARVQRRTPTDCHTHAPRPLSAPRPESHLCVWRLRQSPGNEKHDLPNPTDTSANLLQRAAGVYANPRTHSRHGATRVAARLPAGHSEAL